MTKPSLILIGTGGHAHSYIDEIGYNYRLPNLNAALGLAQLEALPDKLESKRRIAIKYQTWGADNGL